MNSPFESEPLLQAAVSQLPDAGFGPGEFRPSLDLLLDCLRREARLTQPGTWSAVGRVVQSLKRRRLLAKLLVQRPELTDLPVEAPVFIVGFPRTGTTMLHNLLASNTNHRAVRLWEMREPFAPEGADDGWRDATVATTRQLVEAG